MQYLNFTNIIIIFLNYFSTPRFGFSGSVIDYHVVKCTVSLFLFRKHDIVSTLSPTAANHVRSISRYASAHKTAKYRKEFNTFSRTRYKTSSVSTSSEHSHNYYQRTKLAQRYTWIRFLQQYVPRRNHPTRTQMKMNK